MTMPIASHLLGKAGFLGGPKLWTGTTHNDLKQALPKQQFLETECVPKQKH